VPAEVQPRDHPERYHDAEISNSGVWRILKRLEMNRPPRSQRYKIHEKLEALRMPAARPSCPDRRQMHRAQKGSRPKHCQFTAIDDCTRIRMLRIYDRLNHATAIQFVDYVLEKLPIQGGGGPNGQW
jgi:hypothetical protein